MTGPVKVAPATKVEPASDAEVLDIVRNPANYGFKWDGWDVGSKTDKDGNNLAGGKLFIFKSDFPVLPKITDGAKFQRKFGWKPLLEGYNGTSGRVKAQGVVRDMHVALFYVDKGKSLTEEMCRVAVVRRVLLDEPAPRAGGGGTFYRDIEGGTHRTKEECDAANEAHMKARQTFRGLDDVEYKTLLEARQASVAWLMAEPRNLTHEMAVMVTANMTDK